MKTVSEYRSGDLEKSPNKRRKLNTEIRKQSLNVEEGVKWRDLSVSDYDDLIKIKRDKYQDQKNNRRLFLTIGLVISLLMVNIAFSWKFYDDTSLKSLGIIEHADIDEIMDVPVTDQPPPPPPKVQQQVVIVEVSDEQIIEEVDLDFDVEITEETALEEVIYEELPEIEEEEIEEIFQIVETAPQPVGGMSAFYRYVRENLKYPRIATREGIQGRVFVEFVVGKEGKIRDVKVIKGIGGGCDEVAHAIISDAPPWRPGKQRGKAVNVRMVMPITFRLANN